MDEGKSFLRSVINLGAICIILIVVIFFIFKPNVSFLPNADAQTSVKPGPALVTIKRFQVTPGVVTILKGNQVTWVNQDFNNYLIESDFTNTPGEIQFSSPPLGQNESFSYRFDTPGTYTYHDTLNVLNFRGKVVVVDK